MAKFTNRLYGTPTGLAFPDKEPEIATSQTPKDVAFDIPVQDSIPSSVLQGNTTYEDVRAYRAQREQIDQNKTDFNQFDNVESTPTIFNDPEKYILSTLYGDREPTITEKQAQDLRSGITDTISGTANDLTQAEQRASKETGVSQINQDLAETNDKIAQRQAQFRRELRAFESNADNRSVSRKYFLDEKNKLEADATAELADLYIIQNAQQGNLDSARSYIKTAVDNRYRAIEIELQQKQAALAELIPTLEAEEKDRAMAQQIALQERERNLATEKEEALDKRSYMLQVAGAGGSSELQQRILNAPTAEQAAMLTGDFVAKQVRSAASGGGGYKVPTIKEINGVDYQWNEELGIWEEVNVAGQAAKDKAGESIANLNFLLDATDRILGADVSSIDGKEVNYPSLYKGSAQAPLSKGTGLLFTGTNKQRRLEAQVDTLRANMLSLATDPSIKQFFGPQMSDADVRLMTAAGTSLRPGSQSDQELYDETVRIQDWINRARTAVMDGSATTGKNIVTAPDGTRIEIID